MACTCVSNITCNLLEMCREANIARYVIVRRRGEVSASGNGCERIVFIFIDVLVGRPIIKRILSAIGGRCRGAARQSHSKHALAACVFLINGN